jgi:hypothetical protein
MPSGHTARALLTCSALMMFLSAAPQAQPSSFDDLLNDLASAVVAKLTSGDQVQVVSTDPALAIGLQRRLVDRGVRVADAGDNVITVSFTCSKTIRGRVCAAELWSRDARTLLDVERAEPAPRGLERPLVLQLRPLVAHPDPILDVMLAGERLFVLHPHAIARYERATDGWRLQEARATVSRIWPRDVRGRLTGDKTSLDAFLPGISCRVRTESLQVTCTDEARSWPIGIENRGVHPSRNYFSLTDGRTYYSAAALGPDAGARWMAAAPNGTLELLDDTGRPLGAAGIRGDEVASASTTCASGTHVLVPEPIGLDRHTEALRLFRVVDRRLMPVTPPAALTGVLTALWPTSQADTVTAVAYNHTTERYEAFQVSVACGR